jgi:CO/xanthine dehydrogenase Mo-binding subunit
MTTTYRVLGRPTPRVDGVEKVTGAGLYTGDIHLPGMLWGKTLRSPYPHALIKRIDVSKARMAPGVHAVLIGEDLKGILYGNGFMDTPVLPHERVRYAGEPVAAVAAVDEEAAQRALELIEVEYEELPAVFSPEEAMAKDAPILHPDLESYHGLVGPGNWVPGDGISQPRQKDSNIFIHNAYGKGDPEQGFAQSDLVVENTFSTHRVHQGYLEPHACVVWIDDDDRVQVWSADKGPHWLKRHLAEAASIPEERIRLNPVLIGGDFGGKGSPMDVPLCYFLALHSKRPVRMVRDYVEEFGASCPRHPSVVRLKTGVMRDGTMVALKAEMTFDGGAYAGHKHAGYLPSAYHIAAVYRIPHARLDTYMAYTNNVPGGIMRGPGEAQALFAMESHVDMIARQLGMDPVEFRMKNLVEEGQQVSLGQEYDEIKAKEALDAAIEASGYNDPKPPNVGRGIAIGERTPGWGTTHSAVTMNPDGSVVLNTSVFDQGTGTYTTIQQIVAEELGLTTDEVQVEVWDTDKTGFDTGMGASKTTRLVSQATYSAARDAIQEMQALAADLLGWPAEQIVLEGNQLHNRETGERRPWAELLTSAGKSITGRASQKDTVRSPITSFHAQVAEVSVDPETGEVKLLRLTTAHDVGRIINPIGHQGQINGSVMQGIGFALMEDLPAEEGRITTLSFGEYKMPTMKDIPELRTVLLESESGIGPYKIKGIGENPISTVAPAIINAIDDAVGIRIMDLPVTPEKVYRAVQAKA